MNLMLSALIFKINLLTMNQYVIDNFKLKEFGCRTCSEIVLQKELLIRLDILRKIYGKTIPITSAYRNIEDNMRVNGEPNSAHLRGAAVDVVLPKNPKRFLWIARKVFPVVLVNYQRNYAHLQLKFNDY